MIHSAKILVGISVDPYESKELISWAISVLAHPNDHIVAIHFLTDQHANKHQKQSRIRQAKAHVISVLGDFATVCQQKQINLEARVGFSSGFAKGLVEEAKSISADYLILQGIRKTSNRWNEAIRYCLKHAPESCTVVSLGTSEKPPQVSESPTVKETNVSNSEWLCKNNGAITNAKSRNKIQRNVSSRSSVLYEIDDQESQSTEEADSISFEGSSSSMEYSPHSDLPIKTESNKSRYQIPGSKLISSIFTSPLRIRKQSFSRKENQEPQIKCFSYEEIANATNNFHPDKMVGKGGYSEVYRGDFSDGRTIAVKRLAKDNKDGVKEKEFLIELGIMGQVCHPNTATLLGYCIENGLYLVFSFSQNGNLASALHGKRSKALEWEERYKIALGVGNGLHYLHKCCKHRIIHRDIKASNVLLGPNYEPQITDFGLAKWVPNKMSDEVVIPIEGTFGYLAPEYLMHGFVDDKTDVFAFGILLLEILSGRRPVDSSKQNLLLWAKPLMEAGKIRELADPKLQGKYDEDQMYKLVLTASFCVRQSSIWRPSMTEVLELLTNGRDSEVSRSWKMPKFSSDELDDYSMVYGYDVPLDISLDDYL
ncbi:Protein kinase superfamily protein [Euphorbia peplus]|nr:Protein kinase superfamily protein [Euphorbia peplus]